MIDQVIKTYLLYISFGIWKHSWHVEHDLFVLVFSVNGMRTRLPVVDIQSASEATRGGEKMSRRGHHSRLVNDNDVKLPFYHI